MYNMYILTNTESDYDEIKDCILGDTLIGF